MRGVNIGYIKNIKMDLNSILVLVYINSTHIFIPKNCVIEINQTGLLSDFIIDIIPLESIYISEVRHLNLFSKECHKSKFVCHSNYIYGHKGLNYDDLIRAATRISQRFDDPRFFNSFYIFIQNGINTLNELNYLTNDLANISNLFYCALRYFLLNFVF